MALCLIQFLRVELDASFRSEELTHGANKNDSIFFVFYVVGNVGLGVVAHAEPVKYVRHKFEIGLAEVFHGDVTVVAECAHVFAEVSKLSEGHIQI